LQQAGDLVLHQRDKGTDDKRGASAREAWQLVAEGFAGTGRHDQQSVASFRDSATDLFLSGAEAVMVEVEGGRHGRCFQTKACATAAACAKLAALR
jgi:hypothetical protein